MDDEQPIVSPRLVDRALKECLELISVSMSDATSHNDITELRRRLRVRLQEESRKSGDIRPSLLNAIASQIADEFDGGNSSQRPLPAPQHPPHPSRTAAADAPEPIEFQSNNEVANATGPGRLDSFLDAQAFKARRKQRLSELAGALGCSEEETLALLMALEGLPSQLELLKIDAGATGCYVARPLSPT